MLPACPFGLRRSRRSPLFPTLAFPTSLPVWTIRKLARGYPHPAESQACYELHSWDTAAAPLLRSPLQRAARRTGARGSAGVINSMFVHHVLGSGLIKSTIQERRSDRQRLGS